MEQEISKVDVTHEISSLEFLVEKSRVLLKEQMVSYENCIKKSGIFISAISLFIPISIALLSSSESIWLKNISLLAVALSIYALWELFKVLTPKSLAHGFNFTQFNEQYNKGYRNLLIFEIKANNTTYNINSRTVNEQLILFRSGVRHAVLSMAIILSNLSLNLIFTN